MSRSKERNGAEYYKAIIRKQRSEIKALRKELSRLNKRKHQYEDVVDLLDPPEPEVVKDAKSCPACKKDLDVIELGIKKMYICDMCGHRELKHRG